MQTDFRHYVEKHRPDVGNHIVGWQTLDHPTTNELVALARRYFSTHEGMAAPMKQIEYPSFRSSNIDESRP
ncbi:hypothetical protein ACSFBI_16965 [Variovorax sp. RB3P1]|uniref:hypothetical protein n=1 Tax=Variovorax sp. RB3P1 TaxID=3443732 RepID=UPI003F45F41F